MPSTISKAIVAALAFGVTNALPHSGAPVPRADAPADNTELLADLITTPTHIKRFQKLLTDAGTKLIDSEDLAKATVFDFSKGSVTVPAGHGGTNSAASIETFPILLGSGMMLNYATLGPCGLFIPHVHPRANEFFYAVEGEFDFGYMLEIGLLKDGAPTPQVPGKLTKNTGTLFPQGSIHFQVNDSPACKPAAAFVMLSSEDPGTTPFLQSTSGTNATVSAGKVDGDDLGPLRAQLPPQIVSMVDKCVARCGGAKA